MTATPERRTAINWFKYAAPTRFYPLAGKAIIGFSVLAAGLGVIGMLIGFGIAPTDAQQGDAYRIIFLHVPTAWLSMVIYIAMAFWAGVGLVFNTRLASMLAQALAPTGALMTFIALWTGALWGKPTWGTWWVWDARLTSELILLFLYLGFLSLHAAIDDERRADRATAVLALVGVVNVPIIYFSVQWWNTLHQGTTVDFLDPARSSIAPAMLWPLLVMALATHLYFFASILGRTRAGLLSLEGGKQWVRLLVTGASR